METFCYADGRFQPYLFILLKRFDAIAIRVLAEQHIPDVCVLPATFYTIAIVLAFALSRTDGEKKMVNRSANSMRNHFISLAPTMTLETCVHDWDRIFALVCLSISRDRHNH